jgi:hypothetical protein
VAPLCPVFHCRKPVSSDIVEPQKSYSDLLSRIVDLRHPVCRLYLFQEPKGLVLLGKFLIPYTLLLQSVLEVNCPNCTSTTSCFSQFAEFGHNRDVHVISLIISVFPPQFSQIHIEFTQNCLSFCMPVVDYPENFSIVLAITQVELLNCHGVLILYT